MHVICTAGHVDHGKSTVVEALTGMSPDRLIEERERQMTIDLGFAWINLPPKGMVGIVDVPGHRDFIGNMLAGVSNVTAALLVVAADEGVMPQTKEHIAIIDLLQISNGVIVITKTDLAENSDWVKLVEEEVNDRLSKTTLSNAELVHFTATSGDVTELRNVLVECLPLHDLQTDIDMPRLNIDRVFTMAGFGTIVTGTLSGGYLKLGDEVEILPIGLRGRIRGLQNYKTVVEVAGPGVRVAINVSGIDKNAIGRGAVLTRPEQFHGTRLIDVSVRLLSEEHNLIPLRHNEHMKIFIGSAEVMGRVRIVGSQRLMPGENGWLQLELSSEIVVQKGDRFILRRPSPGNTIGGGQILDDHPGVRHSLQDSASIKRFEIMSYGSPNEILLQSLESSGIMSIKSVLKHSGLELSDAIAILDKMISNNEVMVLGELINKVTVNSTQLVLSHGFWDETVKNIHGYLSDYHQRYPLRIGMPREELKSRMNINTYIFNNLIIEMATRGEILINESMLALPMHRVILQDRDKQQVEMVIKQFNADPHNTPSRKQIIDIIGDEVLSVLLEQGILISIAPDLLYLLDTYESMVEETKKYIVHNGSVTVAKVRDMFCTSRKYALGFLEHMDRDGITVRVGDKRELM